MGQKTHPVGFILQINKNWRSTWFAGDSFATGLEGDVRIRKYLQARLPNAGISRVEISRTSKTVTVTDASHGAVIGDFVTISSVSGAIGGLSQANLPNRLPYQAGSLLPGIQVRKHRNQYIHQDE